MTLYSSYCYYDSCPELVYNISFCDYEILFHSQSGLENLLSFHSFLYIFLSMEFITSPFLFYAVGQNLSTSNCCSISVLTSQKLTHFLVESNATVLLFLPNVRHDNS